MLALFLINVRQWFVDPFAPHQIVAWLLLFCSLYLVIVGVLLLHRRGKSTPARADASLYDFEKTTALVTDGLYRYIRHPLYSSLLFLTWGIFFKDPSWPGGLLRADRERVLFATARVEEGEKSPLLWRRVPNLHAAEQDVRAVHPVTEGDSHFGE